MDQFPSRIITLSGIGGISEPLRKTGLLHVRSHDGDYNKVLCYLFDRPVNNTQEILLFSLRVIREAGLDTIHHMDQTLMGISGLLLFPKDLPRTLKKKKILGYHVRKTKNLLRSQASKVKMRATAIFLKEHANKIRVGGISPI